MDTAVTHRHGCVWVRFWNKDPKLEHSALIQATSEEYNTVPCCTTSVDQHHDTRCYHTATIYFLLHTRLGLNWSLLASYERITLYTITIATYSSLKSTLSCTTEKKPSKSADTLAVDAGEVAVLESATCPSPALAMADRGVSTASQLWSEQKQQSFAAVGRQLDCSMAQVYGQASSLAK